MASFGAGIDRESVFVEKFEALFTKHLAGAGNLMICLLACFDDALPLTRQMLAQPYHHPQ
jgi:hypothetical protein